MTPNKQFNTYKEGLDLEFLLVGIELLVWCHISFVFYLLFFCFSIPFSILGSEATNFSKRTLPIRS